MRHAASSPSSASASAAPSTIGCSTLYRAAFARITSRARASSAAGSSPHGSAWASTSRYWPTVTSVRIRSNTARARSARGERLQGERPGELLLARDEREVAEQDRGRHPEALGVAGQAVLGVQARERPVRGGEAAAGVGVVHDVVVEQRGRLEQLERRPDPQHRVRLGGPGRPPCARQDQ